ncbi:hypothetical protein ES703_91028 [subsurface metagenome]
MKTGKKFEALRKAIETAVFDAFIIHIADETFVVADPNELHQIHTLWVCERAEQTKRK